MSDIEIALFNARARKSALEMELESTKSAIASESFPKSGNFADLQIVLSSHALLEEDIVNIKQKIAMSEQQINELQASYALAHSEHEKIKYLHETQIKAMLDKIKRKSQNELDEIATMGYFRKHKDENVY